MKKHRHATIVMSPPARRRGLKRLEHEEVPGEGRVASRAEAWIETIEGLEVDGEELVASRAEAWIETGDLPRRIPGIAVASRAEAWIETREFDISRSLRRSPPARRRGLKRSFRR